MSQSERIEALETAIHNQRVTIDAYAKLAVDITVQVGSLQKQVTQLLSDAARRKPYQPQPFYDVQERKIEQIQTDWAARNLGLLDPARQSDKSTSEHKT
jgi:uncharacterized coiled-coil protein SlyX